MLKEGDKVKIIDNLGNNTYSSNNYKEDLVGKIGIITKIKEGLKFNIAVKLLDENRMSGWLWSVKELIGINKRIN